MNLKFKSSEPDLKFNIQSNFRILNQNVLYLTREIDAIKRLITEIKNNQSLQKQVDEYFEETPGRYIPETSPQTEIEDKRVG